MRRHLLAVLVLIASPASLGAQSFLSSFGLGTPVGAFDARARALGGVGLGLFGPSVLPTDPAAAADQVVPSLSFTLQTTWTDLDLDGATSEGTGTRFPLVGVAYPVKSWGIATFTYSGVLDQRWSTRDERTVSLGGGTARVTDTFESDGGVAAARLGFARRLTENVSVGVSFGTFTGRVDRVLTRAFDSLDVDSNVPDFRVAERWRYSGLTGTVGATVDIGRSLRVSSSLSFSGDIEADPTSTDESVESGSFDAPIELRIGGSAVLAPGLSAVVGLSHADWSATTEDLNEGTGFSATTFGAGLEFERFSLLGRTTPLRVGFRNSDLPFSTSDEKASETAFTLGIGLNLVQAQNIPLARADVTAEWGSRDATDLEERYLRVGMSFRVAGF